MGEREFIRVETIDDNSKPVGGYVSTVFLLLSKLLKVRPDELTAERMEQVLNDCTDEDVMNIWSTYMMLGDIQPPEIYTDNPQKYVCLYQPSEFEEEFTELCYLSDMTDYLLKDSQLVFRSFFLSDDEIIYEDGYQIVITRETYDNHQNDDFFNMFFLIDDFLFEDDSLFEDDF